MKYLIDRLTEKTTWIALLTVIASIVGIELAPEQRAEIATGAAALLAVVLAALRENKNDDRLGTTGDGAGGSDEGSSV